MYPRLNVYYEHKSTLKKMYEDFEKQKHLTSRNRSKFRFGNDKRQ